MFLSVLGAPRSLSRALLVALGRHQKALGVARVCFEASPKRSRNVREVPRRVQNRPKSPESDFASILGPISGQFVLNFASVLVSLALLCVFVFSHCPSAACLAQHSQPSTPSPEFLGLPARGLSDCNDSSCELPAGEILMNYKNVMRFLLRSRFCAMSSSMLPKAAWELSSIYIYIYIYIYTRVPSCKSTKGWINQNDAPEGKNQIDRSKRNSKRNSIK